MSFIFLLFVAAAAWPVLRWHNGARWFVAGTCVASGAWAVLLAVTIFSGAGSQLAGTAAESWTASELRRMQRHGWRLVNGLRVRYDEDIDHVLVGPSGVLVVETKWSASSWTEDAFMAGSLQAAVKQAGQNRKTTAVLLQPSVPDSDVRALIVLWSAVPFAASVPSPDPLVAVINGAKLRPWLEAHAEPAKPTVDADAAWRAVDAQVRKRVELSDENKPRPTPGQAVWQKVALPLLAALAATYAFAATYVVAWRPLPYIEVAAALAAGALLLRLGRLRSAALGWTTMNCGLLIFGVALALMHRR
jgi:hypothetical protein